MKKLLFAIPAALLLGAPAVSSEQIELTEKQQTKLDQRLAGRTAGEPRSCINRNDQRKMTVISDDVLIFESRRNARTIYVNKPHGGCHNADNSIMSYSKPTSSLCRGEIVQLIDHSTRMSMGSCAFGEFVPYTKDAS